MADSVPCKLLSLKPKEFTKSEKEIPIYVGL